MDIKKSLLVTLSGECFAVEFQRTAPAQDRDGVLYLFHIKDLSKNRGERLVSVYRFGPKQLYANDYDARIEIVLLNTLRRAFDSGLLSFDAPFDEHSYKELQLEDSAFAPSPRVSDPDIKQFIMKVAYWRGFRFSTNPGSNLQQFDMPADLEYLGISREDIKRYVRLLGEQEFLGDILETMGRPTAKLIESYDSPQTISLPGEKVFPKGTQYEAFKEISRILRSATREIFIADNYLDESVLDMLSALPVHLVVKLLTYKPPADFRVAVKRFQSQYQRSIEVRLHQKEVHDRAIVIDDMHLYTLGASIKDIGQKLSLLNMLQDAASIEELRKELQTIWASAVLLP